MTFFVRTTAQVSKFLEAIRERFTMCANPPSNDRYHCLSWYGNRLWGLFNLALSVLRELDKQAERDPNHSLWPN